VKVVINFHLGKDVRIAVPDQVLETLRARFPAVTFVPADDEDTMARESADADVFFGWQFPERLVPAAKNLRWIQSGSAGIEESLSPAVRASDILLCNGSGIGGVVVAEHTIALMMALARNLHVAARMQAEARWARGELIGALGGVREFRGSKVAVLGLGPIGLGVAERSAALGAVVRGMRRRPPATPPAPFEAVVGPAELPSLLPWADFVVLAVPHTLDTERLIGKRELDLMRSEAYLVNIARGSVVDEAALVDGLRRGAIAGAALDVFEEEPLPPAHPLWSLPNVICTPHVGGAMPNYLWRATELFIDNLARFLDGRPLRNLVDKVAGYPSSPVE
jgi:phosphoglycerate dehydrogenase-like enzyme